MALDRANIFNFEGDELKKYLDDPFCDCFESTKSFAEALFKDIETKETPHSLLLSANYGMGKTFFATRFTQYLRNKGYKAIYFSAWESDYLQDPFLAFSKVIISSFDTEQNKQLLRNLVVAIQPLLKICTTTLLNSACAEIVKGVTDSFLNFLSGNKEISDFKIKLKELISTIDKKRLIIVVDELDRCRPDYAMKTLECIKHFFEVEGLFVILTTNKESLKNLAKCLYGIDIKDNSGREHYCKRFYDDERVLCAPTEEDYEFVARSYINKNVLKNAIKKKNIILEDDKYNSLNILTSSIAKYSKKANLTMREMKKIIFEIVRMCNEFYEPVRAAWLVCLMVYKIRVVNPENISSYIECEHPFYRDSYGRIVAEKGKPLLFELNNIKNALYKHCDQSSKAIYQYQPWWADFSNLLNYFRRIKTKPKSYQEIENILISYGDCVNDVKKCNISNVFLENLDAILEYLEIQKEEIRQYQEKYGSDDDDEIRMKQYMEIVFHPEKLYTIGEKLSE